MSEPPSSNAGSQASRGGGSDKEACGVCAGDVPPLIGETLTGTRLTLRQAAARAADGDPLHDLTPVQRRIVEDYALRS